MKFFIGENNTISDVLIQVNDDTGYIKPLFIKDAVLKIVRCKDRHLKVVFRHWEKLRISNIARVLFLEVFKINALTTALWIDQDTYHNTHSCDEHIEDLKDNRYKNIVTPLIKGEDY